MLADNKLEQAPLPAPEKPPIGQQIETSPEAAFKRKNENIPVKKKEKKQETTAVDISPAAASSLTDDYQRRRLAAIDDVLAEGLDQVFLKMDPQTQRRFKEEGEKTASKINLLLNKAKVGVSKIIVLIKKWLGLVPGANKFFLEQEAKIKADKILKIKKSL